MEVLAQAEYRSGRTGGLREVARLQQTVLEDVMTAFPDIIPFVPPPNVTSDIFLCALGFEPRCLENARRLAAAGWRIDKCLILTLNSNTENDRKNLGPLCDELGKISSRVETLNADEARYTRSLSRAVNGDESTSTKRVHFDISVAANRLLLRSLHTLLRSDAIVTVLYAEAEIYHPTLEAFNSDHAQWIADGPLGLEQGVELVEASFTYPGQHIDALPQCVVLFPSFRRERSASVISHVDPSLLVSPGDQLVWIIGVPHLEKDQWRVDAMRAINAIRPDAVQYEVSTFDYRDTLRRLELIYRDKWERFNISVSPIGSKLQALGTALVCYLHPDIRLVFAVPKVYNAAQWSEGCREVWQVDMGSMATVRARLDSVGSLSIVE